MIGGSASYPEASYAERDAIWQAHVSYTKGFLWFSSTDASVPADVRSQWADWGYCGDEFAEEADHFPAQLYVREARRLVGDAVLTQNDVSSGRQLGNLSIGMGCYGFDSHCVERYACSDAAKCKLSAQPYAAWQCGCEPAAYPGTYEVPLSVLLPKRREATNLIVPVCSSASHVAYATVRMEPQFMVLGHSAGVVAALALAAGADAAVQDVDPAALHAALLKDGQVLSGGGRPI
jgi:hypothetical protein